MSDKKKNEAPDEEITQTAETPQPENEKKEEPKRGKKEKAESRKAESGEKPEEKKAEAPQAASDAYLRLLAEYDNYRKRSQKEKENLYSDIKADVVTRFLPVYDNLARALNQSTEDEAYRRGVEMIMTQFCTTL